MKKYTMTKIVATLGPASGSKEMIEKLYDAGVTMFRINSSHGDVDLHSRNLNYIREVEKEKDDIIPVLLDLQGPKIRIGYLDNPIEIKKDEILKFKHQEKLIDDIIPVDYAGMADDVKIGEKILIDDGKIQFEVIDVKDGIIFAKALVSGLLKQRKGINIPGSTGSIRVLTDRDMEFVDFAVKNGVDYLGLSFVRHASDVVELRQMLQEKDSKIRIISKIEKPQAVDNIDEIIEVSDGIMVARGDLGIEISTEKVPIVQKTIIRKANMNKKVVIVATQMLESMIENPIPTRAETSDVANAILDGTDAIMLSGETAAGMYPVEAVETMKSIADNVEASGFLHRNKYLRKMAENTSDGSMAIGMAVADITKRTNVKAIVAITRTGFTPILLSESKPSVPILTCCPQINTCRAIKIYRGVQPINAIFEIKIDKNMLKYLDAYLIDTIGMKRGDMIVISGSVPELLVGGTNFIKIHEVGSLFDR